MIFKTTSNQKQQQHAESKEERKIGQAPKRRSVSKGIGKEQGMEREREKMKVEKGREEAEEGEEEEEEK